MQMYNTKCEQLQTHDVISRLPTLFGITADLSRIL